jgi:hypothetical protein
MLSGRSRSIWKEDLVCLVFFPPNGARIESDTTSVTMTEQMLKAIAVAKTAKNPYPGSNRARRKTPMHPKGKI